MLLLFSFFLEIVQGAYLFDFPQVSLKGFVNVNFLHTSIQGHLDLHLPSWGSRGKTKTWASIPRSPHEIESHGDGSVNPIEGVTISFFFHRLKRGMEDFYEEDQVGSKNGKIRKKKNNEEGAK